MSDPYYESIEVQGNLSIAPSRALSLDTCLHLTFVRCPSFCFLDLKNSQIKVASLSFNVQIMHVLAVHAIKFFQFF